MASGRTLTRLRHMLNDVLKVSQAIERYAGGKTFDEFVNDSELCAAVDRYGEPLSEAS